jgi:hypothetical protein
VHGPRACARESKTRARARESWDGNAELDPAANVRPGYDCVTLTRGAAALAVVANTLAVATSFPRSLLPQGDGRAALWADVTLSRIVEIARAERS